MADHDTIAHFRKTFLRELKALFVEVLLLAQMVGLLQLGDLSLDGSKVRAAADPIDNKRRLASQL